MTADLFGAMIGVERPLGFVETPGDIVDAMVAKLFRKGPPKASEVLLDPGCGNGRFIEGVLRWCSEHRSQRPRIIGIELDHNRAETARRRFAEVPEVEICESDFLASSPERYDYIIGNPPYVSISSITPAYRALYRQNFATATGRFDLYLLFFEQAVSMLKENGRLVFITPEKFLYVETGAPLRKILSARGVEELEFVDETTFANLVTYPLVTTVGGQSSFETAIVSRDGTVTSVHLPRSTDSWLPKIKGVTSSKTTFTLAHICLRISCGVATGSDSVFVLNAEDIPQCLLRFAHPTISGREITREGDAPTHRRMMLIPYDRNGRLLPERELGELSDFLRSERRHAKLLARTCVQRKPWYAFHENPPLRDILRPKILYKDIGERPLFVVDREGSLVPRHSVYYVIPRSPEMLDALCQYLRSDFARDWLTTHGQRAASGFVRVQSHVLKQLPIPDSLAEEALLALDGALTA